MNQIDNQHPTSIIIFGASGDLTQRKLIPGLYNLYRKKRLPDKFQIVGVSRSPLSHDDFRAKLLEGAQQFTKETFDQKLWDAFAPHIFYLPGNATTPDDYSKLDQFLREQEGGAANRLYYLSTAPSLYVPTVENLGAAGMVSEDEGWRRIIIEKPFGYDLASAHDLNAQVHRTFAEHQVYRIDHYLGKETAQNILFLRFANSLFEPIWNRTYIDHVQISVLESVDVGHRGEFYDSAGVVRDMFQNHLLQLLALVAMEPPISLDGEQMRNERAKLLDAVRPITLSETVRAQYQGYASTPGVADGSQTPTYAALKLHIDNWRWHGVPFYLRSGKALKTKVSEIVVQFRQPPVQMFDLPPGLSGEHSNILSLCIQPDEGAHLTIQAKRPDTREGAPVRLEFHYRDSFGRSEIPEAYERLLLDALLGDPSLFTRSDIIESSWKIVDPVIKGWANGAGLPLATYARGTWGPVESDELLDVDGRGWHLSCCDH